VFGDLQTKAAIEQKAVDIFQRVFGGLEDAADFQSWLAGQADADLEAVGFPAGQQITFLRSAFVDIADLAAKAIGEPGDGNHPAGYDYTINVKQIVGPAGYH